MRTQTATTDVSRLLRAWTQGESSALNRLTPIVYAELHRLARVYMRHERPGHSLQPTALVNEAYIRLLGYEQVEWKGRAHFLSVAAQAMRRILVDHARRKNQKRGAGIERVVLDETLVAGQSRGLDLEQLDHALAALAEFDARKAQVVEMRFFGGLSVEETAAVLGVSAMTVTRDWNTAKAWLYREMTGRP